jgi:hypothetical protein
MKNNQTTGSPTKQLGQRCKEATQRDKGHEELPEAIQTTGRQHNTLWNCHSTAKVKCTIKKNKFVRLQFLPRTETSVAFFTYTSNEHIQATMTVAINCDTETEKDQALLKSISCAISRCLVK